MQITKNDRYIVMDIDFGVICGADFENAIRFHVRRPTRRLRSPAVRPKFKGDDRYIVMGVNFGAIWAADFDNAIRLYVH